MISLVKKDYDSTKIYRKTQKKGASQTYDTPSLVGFRKTLKVQGRTGGFSKRLLRFKEVLVVFRRFKNLLLVF